MRHLRHRWAVVDGQEVCGVCRKVRDAVKAKRSRSSVRLGKDVERRLAKRFGWVKVGQHGDAVDLIGKFVKVQSKATRDPVPAYLGYVNGIAPIEAHDWVTKPLAKMDALYPHKWPVLALSFVHAGVPTTTFLIVRADDWSTFYPAWAPPSNASATHFVIEAWYWLDVVGKDG